MATVHDTYFDTWIRAAFKCIDYIVETAKVWDQLPDYRREGKLVYFGQLLSYMSELRSAEARGKLTKSQIRKLRNLEKLEKDAMGTIKILEERHKMLKARELENMSAGGGKG